MAKRLGILTGGGDCPGLNAVIRAIVKKSIKECGLECVGILRGWLGLIDGLVTPLDLDAVSGILHRGGTILRTSRTNPYKHEGGIDKVRENIKKFELDSIIAVGGDDTLGVSVKLYEEHGINIVGIPKTIDNDVAATEYTFGFDTAVNIATEAIDRIRTTAESHDRVMVVEVMGRHSGWIALHSGIAGGADIILIPEKAINMDEICDLILKRHDRGKDFSIVVVAEGAKLREGDQEEFVLQAQERDEFGHVRLGGIGGVIGKIIEGRTGYETRVTVLGHIQRGGSPTAFDRVLATRFGVAAAQLVEKGDFGKMVALRANEIIAVPLSDGIKEVKTVDDEMYNMARTFFG